MKSYDIFISYSRKDIDEVETLVTMLQKCIPQLACWFDLTGIESGDEFTKRLYQLLTNPPMSCLCYQTIRWRPHGQKRK